MWTVTCEMVRGILEYYVEHTETGERCGTFDCEPWAEEFAKELNKREQNDSKRIPAKISRRASRG